MLAMRSIGCLLLFASAAASGDETTQPEAISSALSTVGLGELLRIEYAVPSTAAKADPALEAGTEQTPATQVVFVRVEADGFARFPPTSRQLPFRNLELPTIEAMLTTHLILHGQTVESLNVKRQEHPSGLVTVTGLVRQPGVYALPANATIDDAIQAAGGILQPKAEAKPTPVNTTTLPVFGNQPLNSTTVGLNAAPPPLEPYPDNLVVSLRHDQFDLSALASNGQSPQIPAKRFASTRLCIDGVILDVSIKPPPNSNPADDLFKPL